MSGEERKQVLQMLENGTITADQALALIRELEQDSSSEDGGAAAEQAGFAASTSPDEGKAPDAALKRTAAHARELWQIPLWVGVAITVLSALGIYSAMQSAGYGFWFYCLWLPFIFGVALMAVAAWSRTARWLFVNVERPHAGGGPRRIAVGFPLPLELTGWFLRTFGHYIDGLRGTNVDEVIQVISLAKGVEEPLIVNVEDGGGGEHVQVFIG